MGCGGSKGADSKQKPQVEKDRRRLSVGQTDDKAGNEQATSQTVEEDRGTLQELSKANVIDMLNDGGDNSMGRKFSISSTTDAGKHSFQNKQIQVLGEKQEDSALGYTCRKGLKPESPNQDSWSVLKVPGEYTIYGVYDGHGQKGHDVSQFVKDNLIKLIVKDSRFKAGGDQHAIVLREAFKRIQSLIMTCDQTKKLDAKLSGTTCTVAIHDHHTNKVTVAHVADSTCVLGTRKGPTDVTGEALTRDHKPDLPDERARIEKAGGRVVFDGYANHRVYAKNGRYPGLNMSRCLGDLLGHQDCGVSCEPEVNEYAIEPSHHCLLLCSDGIWEFIQPTEAIKIVSEFEPGRSMQAADKLAKEAWDRWIQEEGGAVVDDITVVCVFLQQRQVD